MKLAVPPFVLARRWRPARSTRVELGRLDHHVEASLRHVEADQVAVLGRVRAGLRRPTPVRTCRTIAPYDVPLMRASEIRSKSLTPSLRSFAGIGRCPHSGMPGAPIGPAFRSTITLDASQSRPGIVDARGEIVDVLEDDCLALVLEESRIGSGDLHHGAVGAQASAKHDERAALRRAGRPRSGLPPG